MSGEREVKLRVVEARQRDVGRKIARISRRTMQRLGVSTGDFIEITGPKGSIIAQVWPAYPEDEGKEIIRIDGYMRAAIGVGVGDIVTVRKTRVEPATRVVLAPTEPIRFGPDFVEYVKQFLIRKPISRGEEIIIPVFGATIKLIVVSAQPSYRVYVTDSTEIEIKEEPVQKEVIERAKRIPKVTWEDIGDLEEAKQKIREIVELPLKHPELFKHLG
ncbi:MAG: AAA family ATPase, partial [Crenarchaeota archaeon]|nr:AAA family ATPase [Thermoproteota archaeon]